VKKWLSVVAVLAALPCEATVVYWTGATTDTTVTVLETDATDDCVLFTLAGVPEANPVNPGQPWFAFSRGSPGGAAMLAPLLTARATGTPLGRVVTNGGAVCGGNAQAYIIDL
jgi:hypothetical protein